MNNNINIRSFRRVVFFTIFILIIIISYNNRLCSAEWHFQLDKKGMHEAVIEVDAYYSNLEYIIAITDKPVPKRYLKEEGNVYWTMLRNFYLPRYILFEVSANPLPIAGVYIKEYGNEFYRNTAVFKNLNIVKSVTEGFPEPGAASIFLGNVMNFVVDENEKAKVVGKGYSGFLLSYGPWHIVDNIMVRDNWFEMEIKLKGSDFRHMHDISWSYGVGIKIHDNSEIKNTVYLNVKRVRIDYKAEDINFVWKFLARNSSQELRLDFDMNKFYKGRLFRYMFLFGKQFPIKGDKVALSLSFGVSQTIISGYSGDLERRISDTWTLIIRPSLYFKF